LSIENYMYKFTPVKGFWFTKPLVDMLVGISGCIETTLDIGLTKTRVCIENNTVILDDLKIPLVEVEPSEEDRVVFYDIESDAIYEVLRSTTSGYYKLKAVGFDKAPTIEINGIHMHRIAGTDPWRDTLEKIKAASIRSNDVVLDTCTGLGYTAIASVMYGAREVYTIEIDENVLWIAQRNPWSTGLSSNAIKVFHADSTELVRKLPDSYFTKIIHDPPRFTKSTGDLYSLEFYLELYRVLKRGGVLFHYTGEPRIHGPSILKGVRDRLEKAGFRVLRFDKKALGFIAVKTV